MVLFLLSLLAAALVVSHAVWWSAYQGLRLLHLRRMRRAVGQKRAELKIECGRLELAEAELVDTKRELAFAKFSARSMRGPEFRRSDLLVEAVLAKEAAEVELAEARAELAAQREQHNEELQLLRQAVELVDKIQAKIDNAPWNYRREVAEKLGAQKCGKTK